MNTTDNTTVLFNVARRLLDALENALLEVETLRNNAAAPLAAPANHCDGECCERETTPPTSQPHRIDQVMEALNDPRFTLRSVESLTNKLGCTREELFALLHNEEIEYVTRTRRSDGATLIGLASRN